jgi:hypothetical protein
MANKFWTPSPPKVDFGRVWLFVLYGAGAGSVWGLFHVLQQWWAYPGLPLKQHIIGLIFFTFVGGIVTGIVGIINSVLIPFFRSLRRSHQ